MHGSLFLSLFLYSWTLQLLPHFFDFFSTFLLYTIYLVKDAVSMDGRCNLTQSCCSKVILKAQ